MHNLRSLYACVLLPFETYSNAAGSQWAASAVQDVSAACGCLSVPFASVSVGGFLVHEFDTVQGAMQ